ncbi:chemotaxis protein CheB [Acuticoccus sp. MNP-M23]|uniref:chemotaxis protein CheB n=1 Tax=Acuticoccus sp. MNP-M23 TaxID=3072793 RepID=UPI002815CCA3|nr:chemotaxis protein CheB [Acuticoccus sp. MNP-M23]WMS43742.1 chemotaxis protein CheB [Acuticoccus sp. MNP-M23]
MDQVTAPEPRTSTVPLVGIGASAGGLDALRTMFGALSTDTRACFVVVQHLDPTHKSLLTELLSRSTELPVTVAQDGMIPAAGTIVVIPEDATLTVEHGAFKVERPAPPRAVRTPIDTFFRSLATERGEDMVAIILSGTGSDGTQGARLIKETGGFLIAQEPESAAYDSMPRNAIATGLIDKVLPPGEIPAAIKTYLAQLVSGGPVDRTEAAEAERQIGRICQHLKLATGHDFRHYKEPTMRRRVQRRMQVLSIENLSDYADRLRDDRDEAGHLFRELLISVTAFFRDPDAFEALETAVDEILARKQPGEPVRVWVAGCATGEEAYSLAILLSEKTGVLPNPPRIQIFATDIDEGALATARRAIYPEPIEAYVPQRYLRRYFRKNHQEYQIAEEIREMCIFSTQSLVKDPPFSRLDLLSCRNVLIYLKPEMQERVLPIFHYALQPDGCLLLGPSESVTGHEALFDTINQRWRLFRRRPSVPNTQPRFPLMGLAASSQSRAAAPKGTRGGIAAYVKAAQTVVLADLSPAFAVVDVNRELIFSGGAIGTYLKMVQGQASLDFFNLLHPDLRMEVRSLWHRLTTDAKPVVRDPVTFRQGETTAIVRIIGRPLELEGSQQHFLIAFHDLGTVRAELDGDGTEGDGDLGINALEVELKATRELLQTTTEELESSNEELQSANEELMSMNEELQSSNEELETSKEELQSINEELETVNAELINKVEELSRTNADLTNFLSSTEIATLFLDADGRVRRFTPVARQVFNLIETDLGRRIDDISTRVVDIDMESDVAQVLENLKPIEREVTARDGSSTFMMRILPYRSAANVIEGTVATFVDITPLTHARHLSERRAEEHEFVARLGRRGVAGLSAREMIELLPEELATLLQTDFAKVLILRDDGSLELAAAYAFSAPIGSTVDIGSDSQAGYTLNVKEPVIVRDLNTETRFSGPSILTDENIRSGMSVIVGSPREPLGVIGVHDRGFYEFTQDDISFLETVANILAATIRRDAADTQKRLLLDELRHRVKNTLAVVQSVVRFSLRDGGVGDETVERITHRLRSLALSHDLNFRRDDDKVDIRELIATQLKPYDPTGKNIRVEGQSTARLSPNLSIDVSLLIHELVTNAVKHGALGQDGGTVEIALESEGGTVRMVWNEQSPNPIAAVGAEGAGSKLLRAIETRREINLTRSFHEHGLHCELTITIDNASPDNTAAEPKA